jgi:transcription elongation factor SPT6
MAPFSKSRHAGSDWDENEDDDYCKVMAISWGDGERNSATIVVCLDEKGRVCSRLKLNKLQERDGKLDDLNRLLELIRDERPGAIVIGGFSLSTRVRLVPEITKLVSERLNEYDDHDYKSRRRGGRVPPPEVVMVEDDVARLAMSSKRYEKEFPDFPPLVKYCISLARKVQNPCLEYAGLFNMDEEYKLLRIHPHQALVCHIFSKP